MGKAKELEKGVYGVDPVYEGKKFLCFGTAQRGAWWEDAGKGIAVKDLAGNVLTVVENVETVEEALKELGYELIATT